jgi:hypothetical protein
MTLPCIEVTRAPIGALPGLDVSVETSTGLGRRLAPPAAWETYRASGMLPDDEYRRRYEEHLAGVPESVYRELYCLGRERGLIRFLCTCPDGQFCHTVVLACWLARRYPDAFYTRLALPGDLDDGDEYVDQVVRYAVEHLDAVVRCA